MFDWSGVFDFIATRFPRKPVAYLCLYLGWWVTLWLLSSGNPAPKSGFEIPHIDKVAHFGYFFIGGALLSTWCLTVKPVWRNRRWGVFFSVVMVISLVGLLDEYRQSFTPGRSGNDMGDWIADTVGGAAGAAFVLSVVLPGIRNRGGNPVKSGEVGAG